MKPRLSYIIFSVILFLLLLILLGGHLSSGHSLYLVQIEDPVPRLSFYPWLVHSVRGFREGWFPLWNHLSGTGFPHLANFQSSPLNPFHWAFYFYPSLRLMDVMVIVRLFLMGLFSFMFLRRLNLSSTASGTGAIAFTFSGYVMKHLNEINISTEMWIPLILFLLHGQLRERPTSRRFIISGIVCGMAFLGGNPEAAFYFVVITVLYGLFIMPFRGGRWKRGIVCILGPFLVGGLLSSAQLFPFMEYLGPGWHIHTGKLHLLAAHSPRYFYSLLMPWLCGPYRSFEAQTFTLPYIGIAPVLLALIAFMHPGRSSRPLFFFLVYILVFLSVIYRVPPLGWLTYLPLFSHSGNVKFAMAGVSFCFAAAAAFGLDLVMRGGLERRMLAIALGLLSALVFIAIGIASFDPLLPGLFRPGWLYPLLILLAAGFLLLLIMKRKNGPSIIIPGIAALVALELIVLFPGFRPETRIDPSRWRFHDPDPPDYLARVLKEPIPERFTGTGEAIHHSLNILYGVNDLRAFEGMYPRDYVAAMAKIEGFSMQESVAQFFLHGWSFDVRPENLAHPLIDSLGIKYAFLSNPLDEKGWLLRDEGRVKTYENTEAFPRVFMVRDLKEPLVKLPESKIEVLRYQAERLNLKINCGESGYLVLTDTYFPGWRARLDGEPVRIEKAADIVRAVPVPPGDHSIHMFYQPWGFRLGIWLFLASIFSAIVIVFAARRYFPA
jgi:hypothetical protein